MTKQLSFRKFLYMAPPLELNSDNAFRTLCYRHGADITFTEMVRIDALSRNNKASWSRLEMHDSTPTIVQLLVNNETSLKKVLDRYEPQASFRGFNLNMGCPSGNVIRDGLGCAAIKRIAKTQRYIDVVRSYDYPVSIKMRLGLNREERDKKVYLNLINKTTPDFFIVHARDGSQKYTHKADISVYSECVGTGKIIVANGDIDTVEKIDQLKNMGVHGAMIGRLAVQNPACFDEFKGKTAAPIRALREEYNTLAEKFGSTSIYTHNVLRKLGHKGELGGTVQG